MGQNDYDEQDNPSGIERTNFHNIPIRIGGKVDQNGNETQRGEQIQIGRIYMYEPGFPLSNLRIAFPKGCPKSTLIKIVMMKQEEKKGDNNEQ